MTDIQNLLQLDQELLLTLNGSNSLFLDGWMTYLTSGFTWIPLYISLLYLVIKNNETMAQILLILGCSLLCVAMADGVADFLVKPLVGRWRPSNDPIIKYTVRVVGGMRGGDYGFFWPRCQYLLYSDVLLLACKKQSVEHLAYSLVAR